MLENERICTVDELGVLLLLVSHLLYSVPR